MNRLFNMWTKAKPDKERRTTTYRTPRPVVGQSIACLHVMLKVTAPIGMSLWEDLLALGWRTVDPQTERRSYAPLNPDAFDDLLLCDRKDLLDTHRALMLQKPHPLGVDQPRPNKGYPGLPGQVHWQGGQPQTDDTLLLAEEDLREFPENKS